MIPRETEDARRKRKVREWLAELGPGLDVQVGVDSVSEVGIPNRAYHFIYPVLRQKGSLCTWCTISLGRWSNSWRV
jgi:hypothetical protein